MHSTSTFPRSQILVSGPNSIQSLVPATLISQVESLLESHRIEDATDLADQQRKKIQGNIIVNEDEVEELRYVYQRIGFQCFTETLFEDAGKHFFNGDLDPRLLVSYYPDLRGSMFTQEDTVNVFAGVAEHMPKERSVDDIIVANLVSNYSPHLSPNTRSAPPTAELRKILGMAAQEMLESFLRKCRTRRKVDNQVRSDAKWQSIYSVVDTILVKLFAQFEKTTDLYTLLNEANDVIVSEVEEVLQRNGQYNALCMLYKQGGEDGKLLDAWAKVAEGEWIDEDIKDPLSSIISLVTDKRDRALSQKWGVWLTKRDPDRGLKLLMPKETGKRRNKPEEDKMLLEQLKESNPTAALQFLEHLILQRRSVTPDIHIQYAETCVDQLLELLSQDSVSKLWRAKGSSYSSSRTESSVPFLSYFASTTPDSDAKRVRLKTALFLQGSNLYDARMILDRLSPHEKILKLEMAILHGKLQNHHGALSILANELRDTATAEVYCALGGELIPPKVTSSIIENVPGMQNWKFSPLLAPSKPVDDQLRRQLLKVLLEVYLAEADIHPERAAQLLNSQATSLDVLDVLSIVPPEWPIQLTSSFLARSFRRRLHQCHEGRILKAISAGQNLEVKDRSWLTLREEGFDIEEEEPMNEDEVLNEKARAAVASDPVEIHTDKEARLDRTTDTTVSDIR
ncbi:transforming growth factor-beta receptor-associated protein 1 [Moniliophthora roreri MCA 2997]|uniref:Transforming growth factor-beta receptor-associated protein 1 n=1 Tax=Moniliophthora roreri (strain MCA 2997) TaxID=1381753 RepID=V2X6X1_MONRO|nr:transforming growth factor-beta receptor-associated protein 1 [Moniliophthora roreri MCA 2997]